MSVISRQKYVECVAKTPPVRFPGQVSAARLSVPTLAVVPVQQVENGHRLQLLAVLGDQVVELLVQ